MSHRLLLVLSAAVAVLSAAAMLWLWPGAPAAPDDGPSPLDDTEDARIVEVREEADEATRTGQRIDVVVELKATGERERIVMYDDAGWDLRVGAPVEVALFDDGAGGETYQIIDFRRGTPLLLLGVFFVAAVVAFAGWQGVRALGGLLFTLAAVGGYLIPAVAGGAPIIGATAATAGLVLVVTLYLSHGLSLKTSAAVLGTAAAVALTGALAHLFLTASFITGITEPSSAILAYEGVPLTGLLLAAIIIGALGVLDDVTISQAATVEALWDANPELSRTEVVAGALKVGRDHVAATINTLFLAYTAAAMPLLLGVALASGWAELLLSEAFAIEVIRTLVGSIGLIAAVPATTVLAAVVLDPRRRRAALPAHTGGVEA